MKNAFMACFILILIPFSLSAQTNLNGGLNGNVGVVVGAKGDAGVMISTDSYHRLNRYISFGPSIDAVPFGSNQTFAGALIVKINLQTRPIQFTPFFGFGYIYSKFEEESNGVKTRYDADGYYIPGGLTARYRIGRIVSLLATGMVRYHDLDYGDPIGEDKFSYSLSAGFILHL